MSLPPGVAADRVEEIDVGLSGARVARLYVAGRPTAVFKSADAGRRDLVAELVGTERRLRLLAGTRLPVPRLLDSGRWRGSYWLTMEHLPGRGAHEPGHDRAELIALLARALRDLHAVPVAGLPLPMGPDVLLEQARERVASGAVDRGWRAQGHTPRVPGSGGRRTSGAAAVLTGLADRLERIPVSGPVLLHGDYCLPNVLVDGEGGWSLIDLGRVGVGDRHLDLADMTGSMLSDLNPSFGPRDAEAFLDAYGRDLVDPGLLELYRVLDDFFWPE
ncbi:aminoglycoside 3'-phosphotransferase [Nocardiopsis sp. NPDC057823]|uniref:aminoglycoside 3'-phosphotransferase n=1 Tax=Nocardiopsis sp. NPDC057823 TaxID=3346256 RepID=UPI00366BD59E